MMSEKNFEDIIEKYPELIELGLKLIGRQVTLFGRRMDLLFEDKFRRKLIIELKVGPIKDVHIGQILSYEGMILSDDDPTVRVMLIGNRVPPNIQKSLDHHGIAWREISYASLKSFLIENNDQVFLKLFEDNISSLEKKDAKVIESINHRKDRVLVNANNTDNVGIKIYKGAPVTMKNIDKSFVAPINFSKIDQIKDVTLRLFLVNLKNLNEQIYAWAGVERIRKKLERGMKIVFLLVDSREFYVFDYEGSFRDNRKEFQKYVGWSDESFENLVFLKNRIRINLDNNQIEKILTLAEATYRDIGFAGYKHLPILDSNQSSILWEIVK